MVNGGLSLGLRRASPRFAAPPDSDDATPLPLHGACPVASGATRLVFSHPYDPSALIKVCRPGGSITRRRWLAVRLHRELRIALALQDREPDAFRFVAPLRGTVGTSYGVGLVVEAVRDAAGALAPTLSQLVVSHACAPILREAFEHFWAQMLRSSVVAGDLHPSNVVLDHRPGIPPRLVLVDGLGDKTLVPLGQLHARISTYQKKYRLERLRRFLLPVA